MNELINKIRDYHDREVPDSCSEFHANSCAMLSAMVIDKYFDRETINAKLTEAIKELDKMIKATPY